MAVVTKRLTACISLLLRVIYSWTRRKRNLSGFVHARRCLGKKYLPNTVCSQSVHLSLRVVTLCEILAFYLTASFPWNSKSTRSRARNLSPTTTAPTPVLRRSRSHDATSDVTSRILSRLL